MSEAISEMMEGEFLYSTIDDVIELESKSYVSLWKQRTYLKKGSLLSKSCQCALKLVNHDQELQMVANNFGQYLAYTQQVTYKNSNFNHIYLLYVIYNDYFHFNSYH